MGFARRFKIIVTAVVICGFAGLLVWGFLQGRKEQAVEQEREKPITATYRVSIAPCGGCLATGIPTAIELLWTAVATL